VLIARTADGLTLSRGNLAHALDTPRRL